MSNEPVRRYRPVEIQNLMMFCDEDECENIQLIFEGTYETIPETHKLKCPKCLKEFHTHDKPGIVYIPR